MATCPWCGEPAGRLHPVPPEVVTRELVSAAGGAEAAAGLEGCAECISGFMDGAASP